jgi:hypothetical protein
MNTSRQFYDLELRFSLRFERSRTSWRPHLSRFLTKRRIISPDTTIRPNSDTHHQNCAMPIDIANLTSSDTPETREAEAGKLADAFIAAGVVSLRPASPARW